MRACGTLSVIVSRVSALRLATFTAGCAMVGPAGMAPKYLPTFSLAVARSMSPASTSTALFGPYQVRNQVFTSSSDAAFRSFIEPITPWWYGWPTGYSALLSWSQAWP
ncbi:Uncharacterised protein [Stenotrophomonas maltophilia]|nr:Uncharacterised protein [Stenotrophomonas maltophilia]